MIYRLTSSLNDGKKDAAPLDIMVADVLELEDMLSCEVLDEMLNDQGIPFGPGFTLTIERIE